MPGIGIGQHAGGAGEYPEIAQRLERAQRIGIEFSAIIDARQPRPRDEVVRQDLVPEVDDFLGLGEEPVAANVEQEILVPHGAADAADIDRSFSITMTDGVSLVRQ